MQRGEVQTCLLAGYGLAVEGRRQCSGGLGVDDNGTTDLNRPEDWCGGGGFFNVLEVVFVSWLEVDLGA